MKISEILKEPRLNNIRMDESERIEVHREILKSKPMTRKNFTEIYKILRKLDDKHFENEGLRIEIGGGVSFFKDLFPDVISTDVVESQNLDDVIDAQNMKYEDNTIRCIYAQNVFHHLPDPDKFLKEVIRTTKKGGGFILLEPADGFIAKRFYKNIFKTETFDLEQKSWKQNHQGPMVGANQALSSIVFKRDRKQFEKKYPELEIKQIFVLNNYIRYFVSGGLNFRTLLPNFSYPILKLFEFILFPFRRFFGMHHIIVVKKV